MLDRYWLPPAEGWAARIRALEEASVPGDAASWEALVALAGTRLDFLRHGRLDRALVRLFGAAPPPVLATRPVRLGLLGSSTTAHLAPAIRVGALARGVWVQIYEGEYGQYRQEAADPASGLHRFRPDSVLLALDAHHLLAAADPALTSAEAQQAAAAVLDDLAGLWSSLREAFGCQIFQQTLLPVLEPILGLNEERLPGSGAALLARVNAALRAAAPGAGVALLALDHVAALTGVRDWHEPALWLRAKQEVTPLAAPLYGDLVGRLLAAAQGRSAKCLVLDLDNTVWGGVIGDDGLDGIVLGQGSARGEAYVAVQRYARDLGRRGVILAACSKNDEANALMPFDQHPDMVLRRTDLAAFVANWDDKATNLREIARRLNIGLEALVFVDDNPFERNLIRRELPMVAVPELPDDPALYPRCLADGGYFEALGLTDEDRARTASYQANAGRQVAAASATDLDGYLRALDMRLVWRPFDRVGQQRIAQLIGKTNQFNLTTLRRSEAEVATLIDAPDVIALQLRLLDRFGDNGMIAVVIGRISGARLAIDTWLMSCRVLGRGVEQATLALLADVARARGVTELEGRYHPTAKNGMVADLYDRLGFVAAGGGAAGERHYLAGIDVVSPYAGPIAVERG